MKKIIGIVGIAVFTVALFFNVSTSTLIGFNTANATMYEPCSEAYERCDGLNPEDFIDFQRCMFWAGCS